MKIRIRNRIINFKFKSSVGRGLLGVTDLNRPYSIEIKQNLEDIQLFETFLHECLHQLLPDWEENAIEESSEDIANSFYKIFDIDIQKKELFKKNKRKRKK